MWATGKLQYILGNFFSFSLFFFVFLCKRRESKIIMPILVSVNTIVFKSILDDSNVATLLDIIPQVEEFIDFVNGLEQFKRKSQYVLQCFVSFALNRIALKEKGIFLPMQVIQLCFKKKFKKKLCWVVGERCAKLVNSSLSSQFAFGLNDGNEFQLSFEETDDGFSERCSRLLSQVRKNLSVENFLFKVLSYAVNVSDSSLCRQKNWISDIVDLASGIQKCICDVYEGRKDSREVNLEILYSMSPTIVIASSIVLAVWERIKSCRIGINCIVESTFVDIMQKVYIDCLHYFCASLKGKHRDSFFDVCKACYVDNEYDSTALNMEESRKNNIQLHNDKETVFYGEVVYSDCLSTRSCRISEYNCNYLKISDAYKRYISFVREKRSWYDSQSSQTSCVGKLYSTVTDADLQKMHLEEDEIVEKKRKLSSTLL